LPARTAATLTGTRAADPPALAFAIAPFVVVAFALVVVHRAPRCSVASETAGCALKAPGERSEGAASSAVIAEEEAEAGERDRRRASREAEADEVEEEQGEEEEIEEEEEEIEEGEAGVAPLLLVLSAAKSA
jgi:uncharacterized membrane protein YdbT with pleckstrin-like domain